MSYAIETHNLTKRYKDLTAVDNLELKISEGELFALLGVNGAGKTTTIKMLSTLSLPTSGEAFIFGENVVTSSLKVKEMIGVSPQETAVAPALSVKENLALMCAIHGMKGKESAARIRELSSALELDEVMGRWAGKLSGGWQRRLSIAMALVSRPKLLFLDEPTLGLDVIARSELWDLIRELKKTTTIVLTTHYMEEAESLSDRIGVMKKGHLLFTGSGEEMKKATGKEKFEEAFVAMVKEERR